MFKNNSVSNKFEEESFGLKSRKLDYLKELQFFLLEVKKLQKYYLTGSIFFIKLNTI